MKYLLEKKQNKMIDVTHEFCEQVLQSHVSGCDLASKIGMDGFKQAARLGIHYPELTERLGGAELCCGICTRINREIAHASADFYRTLSASRLGSRPVMFFGSEAQKEKVGQSVMLGELWAFALTEAGLDQSAQQTTAIRKGDEYILNGRKCFVTNGLYADHFTVFAMLKQKDDTESMCCFIVDHCTTGVKTNRERDDIGLWVANLYDVIFEEVHIPKENLVGEEGQGFRYAMITLENSRIDAISGSLGVTQTAFEYAVKYVQERDVFEQLSNKNKAIQFMVTDLKNDTTPLLQQNVFQLKTKSEDRTKPFVSDIAMQVCLDTLKILRECGYIEEYPLDNLLCNVKMFQIHEGINQMKWLLKAAPLQKDFGLFMVKVTQMLGRKYPYHQKI